MTVKRVVSGLVIAFGLSAPCAPWARPGQPAAGAGDSETVRQERALRVDGATERWRLKWAGPVKPFCATTDPSTAATCPCAGFAYGEQGKLSLERERPGAPPERLDLSALFADADLAIDEGNAALPRWPRAAGDPSDDDGGQLSEQVAQRPVADVMEMQDFMHEGRKTSFLLQVGNLPCGKRAMVLVGTSRFDRHLHAFASAAHPGRPLVLQAHEWAALLRSPAPVTVTDWACGDHASSTDIEKTISARRGLVEVRVREYACREDGGRGRLLRSGVE